MYARKRPGVLRPAFLCATALAATVAVSAWAETLYVSDVLVVDLRAEPANASEALGYLRSDEAVEVIDRRERFVQVRTEENQVGWVAEQYLTAERPEGQVIAELRQQVARLKVRALEAEEQALKLAADLEANQKSQGEMVGELRQEVAQTRDEAAETSRELEQLQREHRQLVEQSRNVVAITEERDRLREEREGMMTTIARLEQERAQLSRSGAIRWFLAGSGVFLVGWLIGATSFRRKKGRFAV